VCPAGELRYGGACVVASGLAYQFLAYQFNDCSTLAAQLAAQRRQMQDQDENGQSLRYRMLQEQYQQCLLRSRWSLGAYALASDGFMDGSLFDLP
jgi:hypothetical protein